MKCVYCLYIRSRVVDSRISDDGSVIRRRRECENCGRRYTTFEKAEAVPLNVIKKSGAKEPFDPEKLRRGIEKACQKRPVSKEAITTMADDIERAVFLNSDTEISSDLIGKQVMNALKKTDEVAYARFSCVYHEVNDLNSFVDELERLIQENRGNT